VKGKERASARVGLWAGERRHGGRLLDWVVRWREEKKERPAGLDRVGEKEREEREREWAGPKEKKREKKNCIQMHLNLNLEFKFKWKTNNKVMQCGMKCTKPIFPYISFYG
jgi:hypothetical protein